MAPDWSGGRRSLAEKTRTIPRSELEGLTSSQKTSQRLHLTSEIDEGIAEIVGEPESLGSDEEALDDDEIEEMLAKYYEV